MDNSADDERYLNIRIQLHRNRKVCNKAHQHGGRKHTQGGAGS